MAVATVEDLTGAIECLIFPSTYQQCQNLLKTDALVGIRGRLSRQDANEEPKVRVEEIVNIEDAIQKWSQALRIRLPKAMVTPPLVDRLERILVSSSGNCMVYIDLTGDNGSVKSLKVGSYRIKPTQDMMQRLNELFGSDNVVLK